MLKHNFTKYIKSTLQICVILFSCKNEIAFCEKVLHYFKLKLLFLYKALLNWILTEDNEIKALNCLIWPYAMYLRLTLQSWI